MKSIKSYRKKWFLLFAIGILATLPLLLVVYIGSGGGCGGTTGSGAPTAPTDLPISVEFDQIIYDEGAFQ